MRISERFRLGKSQYELDFVDIDPSVDTPLFVDPYFLAQRPDAWSIDASQTIRHFFQHFITLLRAGETRRARDLFDHLGEPNETCLGLSRGRPRGNGVGEDDADRIFDSLLASRAVRTGLIEDLEDCRLFVDRIDKDKTSDMATNIIRGHLIRYTQSQCAIWGITLTPGVASGWVWNRRAEQWESGYREMLVVDGRRILLVPKAVVSFAKRYAAKPYYQHFVLSFLQHEHLRLNTPLVERTRRKDGSERVRVTKKRVHAAEAAERALGPGGKDYLARFTEKYPEVFRDFKRRRDGDDASVPADVFTPEDRRQVIDHLIGVLRGIPTGGEHATLYHRTVMGVLELVFYPDLFAPTVEQALHGGRKRIDIVFENGATHGFFHDLDRRHKLPAPWVLAECKNYGREVGNPELDQLAGRFSPTRGKFGLLVCRSVEDMPTLLARCADTDRDDRGLILPLVDADLIALLEDARSGTPSAYDRLLSDRFRAVRFG